MNRIPVDFAHSVASQAAQGRRHVTEHEISFMPRAPALSVAAEFSFAEKCERVNWPGNMPPLRLQCCRGGIMADSREPGAQQHLFEGRDVAFAEGQRRVGIAEEVLMMKVASLQGHMISFNHIIVYLYIS